MMNPVPWLQMTNMISYQGLVRTFPSQFPETCIILDRRHWWRASSRNRQAWKVSFLKVGLMKNYARHFRYSYDPNVSRKAGRGGRTIAEAVKEGINVRVIQESNGDIVSGFPTNVPRNPK